MTTRPEPTTQPVEPTSAMDEIRAMTTIAKVLERVDTECRDRIARWVYDRYNTPLEEA